MKTKAEFDKEKEKSAKMKALRRELEVELEEQLSATQLGRDPSIEVLQIDANQELTPERAKQVVEALLFAASKPLTIAELRRVIRGFTPKQIEEFIAALREEYQGQNRGFEILEIAGGYEMATKREFAPWVMRIELQKKVRQATQSALETLAILAYKQPITRAEIEALRGVDVSGVVNTLIERGFVKIVGKKEVLGRPFLYGTSEKFLEHFGLNALKDLPSIEEIQTIVNQSIKREELLGTTQMVPNENAVPETDAAAPSDAASSEPASEMPGESTGSNEDRIEQASETPAIEEEKNCEPE